MTKQKKKTKVSKRGANQPARVARMVRSSLDAYGLAYARLLTDPCNAPLTGPVYQGAGSGNYLRLRKVLTPIVDSNTSLQFIYDPSTNFHWFGQTIGDATGTIGQATQTFTNTNWKSFRPLAACIKVRYTGPEMDRAGTVGLLCGPALFTPIASGISSPLCLGSCASIHRVGDVMHEVKWMPDNDVSWAKAVATLDITNVSQLGVDNVLHVIVQNTVPSSITLEITAVYEVAYQPTAGMVATAQVSKSNNTFNDVAKALGEPVRWLYGNVVAPTVRSLATGAVNTTLSSVSAAARTGAALLTL